MASDEIIKNFQVRDEANGPYIDLYEDGTVFIVPAQGVTEEIEREDVPALAELLMEVSRILTGKATSPESKLIANMLRLPEEAA